MILYQFLYCPCIHESAWGTISLHRTKEGAKKAMYRHKKKERKEFDDMYNGKEKEYLGIKFGIHEDWCVDEIEVLD